MVKTFGRTGKKWWESPDNDISNELKRAIDEGSKLPTGHTYCSYNTGNDLPERCEPRPFRTFVQKDLPSPQAVAINQQPKG